MAIIDGTEGSDTLTGSSEADRFYAGGGNDTHYVDANDTVIDGGAGTSLNLGAAWIEKAVGGTGKDTLDGSSSTVAVTLYGGAGNDMLTGGIEADILAGNAGTDLLAGGAGDDTYLFAAGDGADTITDRGGSDMIYLGAGLTSANLYFSRTGDDLIVRFHGSENRIIVAGRFLGTGNGVSYVEALRFADGTTVDMGALTLALEIVDGAGSSTICGYTGNDQIWGETGNDAIAGGDGDDFVWGGAGNDTYQFGPGSGTDTILQNDGTSLNDRLFVKAGIRVDQIWFDRVANDLRISLIGTSDQTTVRDWYIGSEHRLDGFFVTDGSKQMDVSQIDQLVAAMATFGAPPAGQFELSQQQQATLDPVLTVAWH